MKGDVDDDDEGEGVDLVVFDCCTLTKRVFWSLSLDELPKGSA
jgi:hypothetical protein